MVSLALEVRRHLIKLYLRRTNNWHLIDAVDETIDWDIQVWRR